MNLFSLVDSDVPLSKFLTDPILHVDSNKDTYFVCRQGNDSQIAAAALRKAIETSTSKFESEANPPPAVEVYDVIGGLRAWSSDADPSFPMYF